MVEPSGAWAGSHTIAQLVASPRRAHPWSSMLARVREDYKHLGISIVADSPGNWTPRPGCLSPRMWIFLYGQYRTFDYTQHNLKQMAAMSTGDCFMVAAVILEKVCSESKPGLCGGRLNLQWRKFASTLLDVLALLNDSRASLFLEHFAYVIVRTTMKIKEAPFAGFGCDRWRCFMCYWYAVYAVVEASSITNEIKVGPSRVVLRTRPDVPFSSYFDLRRASQYFQKGHRGQHLVFGMEYGHAQSDIVMFTSWGA